MAQTTRSEIEFTLQLSPDQYRVLKTLAHLHNYSLQDYVYDKIVHYIPAQIDNIEDVKEREQAEDDWDVEQTSMSADRTIIMHCFFTADGGSMKAIEKVAKLEGVALSECLEGMVYDMADAELNLLREHFNGADEMAHRLKAK